MYRKDIFDAKGLVMPDRPTWQQVADLAAKVDNAQPDMRGICLRGQPGSGQVIRPRPAARTWPAPPSKRCSVRWPMRSTH
jgi:ABC-type glycerol-3-phosphate transport system substrate-binding protein